MTHVEVAVTGKRSHGRTAAGKVSHLLGERVAEEAAACADDGTLGLPQPELLLCQIRQQVVADAGEFGLRLEDRQQLAAEHIHMRVDKVALDGHAAVLPHERHRQL
eukprot:354212-Chlamydomonas_euryale.AAC.2